MIRTISLSLFAALAIILGAFGPAVADAGQRTEPQGKVAASVSGSEYKGLEDLWPDGKLAFQFGTDGEVIMIDINSEVHGTYTQNGASVRIQFGNCVYEGTVTNNVLAGTARFTSGDATGTTWNFRLERQGR